MTNAHEVPAPIKGATHVKISEIVIASAQGAIIVRGQPGAIEQLPPEEDPEGDPVDTFVPDPDIAERVVVLDGAHYQSVFQRGAARGLPTGDFGRADLLAECDSKGW